MSSSPPRHLLFQPAPQEELLPSLDRDGTRRWIDPVTTRGRFWRARAVLGWALVAAYVGLPLVPIHGLPAMWLDLPGRRFHLLGTVFQPTDNLVLLAFGAGIGALVFFVTSGFGRVWCGYACPQTVYLELLFRPIESLIDGKPAARRTLRQAPWNRDKVVRRAAKWALYALLAVALSATFVAYFATWSGVLQTFAAPREHQTALAVLFAVSGLMLFDLGYFRDQMCTVACPYGRLQNVLVDDDTIVVAYDARRGEPRGKPKTADTEGRRGDCVDCGRCIHTCPTGIDIRRGTQLECVGCAQCVEACDEVMARLTRPRGLIRYTSARALASGQSKLLRPRLVVYGALALAAWGAFAYLTFGRAAARIELLRNGREAFRVLPTGQVANQLRVRITNQRHQEQRFSVTLAEPREAELVVSADPIVVPADDVETANLAIIIAPGAFHGGRATVRLLVRSDQGAQFEQPFVLLGPFQ